MVERTLVGPRLLTQSRVALHRITTLAGLFLIDGDPRVLARAKAEMRAVAAFSDWNPSHFLDVAELTAAMALGYDWLYSDLTGDERELFRAAIIAKGLTPGVEAIRLPSFWAAQGRNTWSEVCFGGLTLGALAVAEHAPELAASVLGALKGPAFSTHLRRFAPDGGDVEGPGYWGYSTMYLTFLLSALETALGSDLGLGQTEGLAQLGQFRMYSIGPSGRQLNYADAIEEPAAAPQMLWMAGRFDRPEYAAHEHGWLARSQVAPNVFHVLWSARPPTRAASLPPTSARFRNIDVAVLRSDWRDNSGSWVALKGGSNAASSRAPRPWQLHHRRAGATVGRRSGAGLFQSPGLFWGAPMDVLPASHREPQHAARRWAEPGRERNRAHRRVRRRLVSGLRRHGPDRRVSSGAYASTAGRCPDRRARRADSG